MEISFVGFVAALVQKLDRLLEDNKAHVDLERQQVELLLRIANALERRIP